MTTVVAPATDAPATEDLDDLDEDDVGAKAVLRRLFRDKRAVAAAVVLGFVIFVAIFGPIIFTGDPNQQNLLFVLQSPSGQHPLGTDDLGRDVFLRLVSGTRLSMQASLLAVAVGLLFGVPIGLISGWIGGAFDGVVTRFVDALLSFPGLVLAIAVTGMLGPGINTGMFAVGVIFSPVIARITRAQVMSTKHRLFVDAARVFGARGRRIVVKHVLPNAVQPIIVQASLFLAAALIAEASLSFLGLGAQPPAASWGSMLGRAYRRMDEAPVQVLAPGLAIMITAWAFNALGDALRKALDPREGQ